MAIAHAPGAGYGPGRSHGHGRRTAVIGSVVLACAAITAPFAVHALDADHARSALRATTPAPAAHHPHQTSSVQARLGPHGSLPDLRAGASPVLVQGQRVRIGEVTSGVLRRTAAGRWQVVVRWNGRPQAVPTSGAVTLADPSWVAATGLLYTRTPTGTPGQYEIYAWDAQGGSAYAPPSLIAFDLGRACLDASLTAYGDCHRPVAAG